MVNTAFSASTCRTTIGRLFVNGWRLFRLVKKTIAENEPERGEAILPIDLLALTVIAAGVIDTGFVEAQTPARQFGGQFGLDAKTVGGEGHTREALVAKDLVAGFHVREIE